MPLFSRKKEKAKKAPKPVEEKATENPAGGEDEDSDEAPTQVYRHAYTRTLEVEDGCDTGGVGEEGLGWAWLGLAQRPRRWDVPPRRRRCGVRLCIAVCLCPRARARDFALSYTLPIRSVCALPPCLCGSVLRCDVLLRLRCYSTIGRWVLRLRHTLLESAAMSRFYN